MDGVNKTAESAVLVTQTGESAEGSKAGAGLDHHGCARDVGVRRGSERRGYTRVWTG